MKITVCPTGIYFLQFTLTTGILAWLLNYIYLPEMLELDQEICRSNFQKQSAYMKRKRLSNCDGQQFHQYQQNEQSPPTLIQSTQKRETTIIRMTSYLRSVIH
jgi:hypothetical protein